MAVAEKLQAIPLIKATELSFVEEDGRHYSLTLQLGSKIRWREFGGGDWKRDPALDQPMTNPPKIGYRQHPQCHEVRHVPARTLNGLISSHNEWLIQNRDKVLPQGDVRRMILVSNIKEDDAPVMVGAFPAHLEKLIVQAASTAAAAAVEAMTKSRQNSQGQK